MCAKITHTCFLLFFRCLVVSLPRNLSTNTVRFLQENSNRLSILGGNLLMPFSLKLYIALTVCGSIGHLLTKSSIRYEEQNNFVKFII